MSTEHTTRDGDRKPLPQDEFNDTVLIAEVEPSRRGEPRAFLYPTDGCGAERATRWIAASTESLIPVEAVR